MPKKKKFIDKKKAVTFHVVHRSQHDPLVADESAPQRVLVPATFEKSSKDKLQEEHRKFGIYFDDDYNYLQHLRDVNKTNVDWIEMPKNSKVDKQKINLPSSVFASTVEEEVGLLNKAALQSGLRLDLDPDVVAAMDEDFNFSDPDNVLEDNFIELADKSPSGSECDERADVSDDGSIYSQEVYDDIASLNNFETKSKFTDYSMSSSVISRNSQLTLLDDTFEQMFAAYDDTEIGALDCDEIEGELDVDCPMFKMAADEFEKYEKFEKLTIDDMNKLNLNSPDGSDDENDYFIELKEKEKWDCESILTTYSNIYNHPKLIEEPITQIRVDKRTGIPIETQKLTKQALSQLNRTSGEEKCPAIDSNESSCTSVVQMRLLHDKNIGKESPEEKKLRKRRIKEQQRERRAERKANAAAFREEKKRIEKTMAHNKLNCQGIIL